MTWLSFTIGFVLGLAPGVWFVWQWWSREDAALDTTLDDEQERAEREELQNNESPSTPVDHGPFRTREPDPEPKPKIEVLCFNCVHLRQKFAGEWTEIHRLPGGLSENYETVCSLGPMEDKGPILGTVRGVRSCEETNKNRDCPDHKGYSR